MKLLTAVYLVYPEGYLPLEFLGDKTFQEVFDEFDLDILLEYEDTLDGSLSTYLALKDLSNIIPNDVVILQEQTDPVPALISPIPLLKTIEMSYQQIVSSYQVSELPVDRNPGEDLDCDGTPREAPLTHTETKNTLDLLIRTKETCVNTLWIINGLIVPVETTEDGIIIRKMLPHYLLMRRPCIGLLHLPCGVPNTVMTSTYEVTGTVVSLTPESPVNGVPFVILGGHIIEPKDYTWDGITVAIDLTVVKYKEWLEEGEHIFTELQSSGDPYDPTIIEDWLSTNYHLIVDIDTVNITMNKISLLQYASRIEYLYDKRVTLPIVDDKDYLGCYIKKRGSCPRVIQTASNKPSAYYISVAI